MAAYIERERKERRREKEGKTAAKERGDEVCVIVAKDMYVCFSIRLSKIVKGDKRRKAEVGDACNQQQLNVLFYTIRVSFFFFFLFKCVASATLE